MRLKKTFLYRLFQSLTMLLGIVVSLALHALAIYIIYWISGTTGAVSLDNNAQKYITAKIVHISSIKKERTKVSKPAPVKRKKIEEKKAKLGEDSSKNKSNKERSIKRGGNTKDKTNTTNDKTSLKSGRGVETTSKNSGVRNGTKDGKNIKQVDGQSESKGSSSRSAEEEQAVQSRVQSYVRRINIALVENWTRPSNVAPGDKVMVTLKLTLNRDGSVANVSVQKTSKNNLFDRSAIVAVKKIGRFVVPSDSEVFDEFFQHITLKFKNPGLS